MELYKCSNYWKTQKFLKIRKIKIYITLQSKHNLSQIIRYQGHAYIKQNPAFVDEISNVECTQYLNAVK